MKENGRMVNARVLVIFKFKDKVSMRELFLQIIDLDTVLKNLLTEIVIRVSIN